MVHGICENKCVKPVYTKEETDALLTAAKKELNANIEKVDYAEHNIIRTTVEFSNFTSAHTQVKTLSLASYALKTPYTIICTLRHNANSNIADDELRCSYRVDNNKTLYIAVTYDIASTLTGVYVDVTILI